MPRQRKKLKEDINSRPLVYAAVYLLLGAACIVFPSKWLADITGYFWAVAIVRTVFGALGVVLMVRSGFLQAFKLHKDFFKSWDIVLVGLLIAVNNFPIIALITKDASVTVSAGTFIPYLAFCVSIGFFEEVFFRGLIFSALLIYFKGKKAGDFWAIIISSAVFGLAHLFNLISGADIISVIIQVGYTFLCGTVFALLFYFTKSIYLSILCHALFDVGGLLVQSLGNGQIWNTPTIILTIILSVAAGLYLMLRTFFFMRKKAGNPSIDNRPE